MHIYTSYQCAAIFVTSSQRLRLRRTKIEYYDLLDSLAHHRLGKMTAAESKSLCIVELYFVRTLSNIYLVQALKLWHWQLVLMLVLVWGVGVDDVVVVLF